MSDWIPSASKTPLNYQNYHEYHQKERILPRTTTTTTSTPSKMSGLSKHIPGTKAYDQKKQEGFYNNGSGGGLRDHPTNDTSYNRGGQYDSNTVHPSARTGSSAMPGSYDDMPSGVEESVNPSSGAGTAGQTGLRHSSKPAQQTTSDGTRYSPTGNSGNSHNSQYPSGATGTNQYSSGATDTTQYPSGARNTTQYPSGGTGTSGYAPGNNNTSKYTSGTTGTTQYPSGAVDSTQYPPGSNNVSKYTSGATSTSQYASPNQSGNQNVSPIDRRGGDHSSDARRPGHDDFDTRAAVHQYSTRTHHPDTTPSQLGYGTDGYTGGQRAGYQNTSIVQYGNDNGNTSSGYSSGIRSGYQQDLTRNERSGYQQDLTRSNRYETHGTGQDHYSNTATHAPAEDDRLPPSSLANMTQSTTTTTPSGYTTTTTTTPHTSKPTIEERQAMAGAMQGGSTTAHAKSTVKGIQAKTDRLVGGINRFADDMGERAAQRKYRESDSTYRTDGP